jgi:hypothetical protein
MADNSGNKKGFVRRLLDELDLWDILAALTGGWLGSRQHGAAPSTGGENKNPPPIASKQEDEGNFNYLLNVLKHGGDDGRKGAECLKKIHDILLIRHRGYAEQFRNFFFTVRGITSEEMVRDLRKLSTQIQSTPDAYRWSKISNNTSCFPIVTAKGVLYEIGVEYGKFTRIPNDRERWQKACDIVAQRMLVDGRLPGTTLIHTKERSQASVDAVNNLLQNWNRQQIEKKRLQEEELSQKCWVAQKWNRALPWKWMVALWIGIFILMMVSSISAPPEPKPKTPFPGLSDKVSQKVTGWIESLDAKLNTKPNTKKE